MHYVDAPGVGVVHCMPLGVKCIHANRVDELLALGHRHADGPVDAHSRFEAVEVRTEAKRVVHDLAPDEADVPGVRDRDGVPDGLVLRGAGHVVEGHLRDGHVRVDYVDPPGAVVPHIVPLVVPRLDDGRVDELLTLWHHGADEPVHRRARRQVIERHRPVELDIVNGHVLQVDVPGVCDYDPVQDGLVLGCAAHIRQLGHRHVRVHDVDVPEGIVPDVVPLAVDRFHPDPVDELLTRRHGHAYPPAHARSGCKVGELNGPVQLTVVHRPIRDQDVTGVVHGDRVPDGLVLRSAGQVRPLSDIDLRMHDVDVP